MRYLSRAALTLTKSPLSNIFATFLTLLSCACLVSCSGSSGDSVTFVNGRVTFPANGVIGTSEIPIANALLRFEDFSPPEESERVAKTDPNLGLSDSNANFAVSIEETTLIVLSARSNFGTQVFETGSFIVTDGRIQEKVLNANTALATMAIKKALQRGEITTSDIDDPLIASFERSAMSLSFSQAIDLFDPSSVDLACEAIVNEMFPEPELPNDDELVVEDLQEMSDEQMQLPANNSEDSDLAQDEFPVEEPSDVLSADADSSSMDLR